MIFCRCSKEAEPGSDMCFRCRVSSVGFTFRGGGQMYGRHNFAERTNAEYLAEHVGDVKQGLKDGTIAPLKDFTS